MNYLQTDVVSMNSLHQMRVNQRLGLKSLEQISTGKAIQSAADNAAGLKTMNLMGAQEKSLVMALQNVHAGITLAQTADSALATVTESLQRMRELAVQASNGTLVNSQRGMLNQEYQQLMGEVLSIVENTKWNEFKIFKKLDSTSFLIQAGAQTHETIRIDIPQVLPANLSSFTNGDFETGAVGDAVANGWTIFNSRVTLDGNSTIGGFPTPTDPTQPGVSAGDAVNVSGGTFSSQLVAASGAQGTHSLRLTSSGLTVAQGYGITHGPYMISNQAVRIESGSEVSFDWKAEGGADAYDVYAYLLNTDDGSTIELLNRTGSGTASSGWQSVSQTVNSTGNYKFVFVSGTFDETGGRALGAQLFVDNIYAPPTGENTILSTDLNSSSNASAALSEVDLNIESVDRARASLGATLNRMTHAIDHLLEYTKNINHSKSQIADTHYTAVSGELVKTRVSNEAAEFVLKQVRTNQMLNVQIIQSNDNLIG